MLTRALARRPARVSAVPARSAILGYFGADVIKVEPPKRGDALRALRHLDDTGTSLWWRSNVSRAVRCGPALRPLRVACSRAPPVSTVDAHPPTCRPAPGACTPQGRNKRSVTLDLHNPEAQGIVRQCVSNLRAPAGAARPIATDHLPAANNTPLPPRACLPAPGWRRGSTCCLRTLGRA